MLLAGLSAAIGIYLVSVLSNFLSLGTPGSEFLVGSFGASAVLLYAAPDAEFSQPRNLLGGHILSALIGVTLYRFVPLDVDMVAALAVALAIVAMLATRTVHPPGGATALIAVIGSSEVHAMGYGFVLAPIASGALILLTVAVIANNLRPGEHPAWPRRWW